MSLQIVRGDGYMLMDGCVCVCGWGYGFVFMDGCVSQFVASGFVYAQYSDAFHVNTWVILGIACHNMNHEWAVEHAGLTSVERNDHVRASETAVHVLLRAQRPHIMKAT